MDVFAGCGILQAGEGGGTGQIGGWIQGVTIQSQLEHRVGPECIGIIAVHVGTSNLIAALGKQGMQFVGGI